MQTIEFIGVRGGHGTTTVALVAAATLANRGPTGIAAHDPDAVCVAVGTTTGELPLPLANHLDLKFDGTDIDIVDAGTLEQYLDVGPFDDEPARAVQSSCERLRIGVLRGPDYVGLRTLCGHQEAQLDGIIVVAEAGRALDARDVEHVARAIDAGLLLSRCRVLREFAQLRDWVAQIVSQEAPCAAHA